MSFLDFREPVNAWSHCAGLLLAGPGSFVLWRRTAGEPGKRLTIVIYGFTLAFCYLASTLYHAVRVSEAGIADFARLDSVGIFALIAGSYTPMAWCLLRGRWRRWTLALVWSVAGIATILIASGHPFSSGLATTLYLAMGWAAVVCYFEIAQTVSHRALRPLVLGGVCYSVGAVLNVLRWPVIVPGIFGAHEIFHFFVLAGSLAHYWFIFKVVAPTEPLDPGKLSTDAGDAGQAIGAVSSDDSWLPPPPDGQVDGSDNVSTNFGWPSAPEEGALGESATRPGLIDTEIGGTDGDQSLPEVPGFVIVGECGRGGMGIVYLAEQVDLGRRVALKFLKAEFASSGSLRARLAIEATALARLQHPNIVQIFSSGMHKGRSFIAQEYVGGGSLDQKLTRQPATAWVAAEMVATLARAVAHAHSQRIIHRDLKPSNVLLTFDGIPKISDFGLAKQSDLDGESNRTQSGAILGSPSYMAPEQSLGKRGAIGPAADIYALGAVLYEMLTGRPPFLAASTLETLEQVRTAEPVPPRQLQPGLPRDIETICLTCLRKDPSRRYESAAALAEDLDRFLEGHPILARPASRVERLAKWVKRHPATAASSGVAALAASALLIGGLLYQSLLRAALSRAEKSAERARIQEKKADARYRLAHDTLTRMLERLRDRDLRQTPRLKELEREQMGDVLEFYREVAKDRDNSDPAVRFDVASAALQSGNAEITLGRRAEGRGQLDRAIADLESLVDEYADQNDYRLRLATGYRLRALLGDEPESGKQPGTGAAAAALDLKRSALLLQKLVEQEPQNRTYRAELATTYHNLGSSHHYQHRAESAATERYFRRAIDLRRSLLDADPNARDAPIRVQAANSLQALAVVVQQTDHAKEVPRLYADSRELLEGALKVEPAWDEATLSLGFTLLNWGVFLSFAPASHDRAETLLRDGVGRLAPILQREPEWERARIALASIHGALASLLDREHRYAEAAREWEQTVATAKANQKNEHRFMLAMALARAGDHRKAWRVVEELRPSLSARAAVYHFHLAVVCGVCLGAAEKDTGLSANDRAAACEDYGRAGVQLQRDALRLIPIEKRLASIAAQETDPDLAPLRRRADFQAMSATVAREAKVNSGAALAPRGSK